MSLTASVSFRGLGTGYSCSFTFKGYASGRRFPLLPRTPTFPDVGRLCVTVPKKTENALRFSARLHEGVPGEVRVESIDEEIGQRFFVRPEAQILISLPRAWG
jgi:hypothetical protein